MPSRIIKESIVTSESLTEISAEAERFFWRLVVKADDYGLYYGNPRILASMCFPMEPPKERKVVAWLGELVAAGMVGTYTAAEDGKKYLKLLSWDKHQQTRAKKSKYPLPVTFDNTCKQTNGKQVKSKVPVNVNENGNENEKRETGTRPDGAQVTPPGFDRFWSVYPRRVGKQDALKAWGQLQPDEDLVGQIVAGVERWKTSDTWTKDGGKFICYPATFLRGRRWEEDNRPDALDAAVPGRAARNYDGDEDFLGGR